MFHARDSSFYLTVSEQQQPLNSKPSFYLQICQFISCFYDPNPASTWLTTVRQLQVKWKKGKCFLTNLRINDFFTIDLCCCCCSRNADIDSRIWEFIIVRYK